MPGKRVLIVEDDRNIVLTLERTLGREGYDVRTARDGTSAKQEIASFKPDVVLLDRPRFIHTVRGVGYRMQFDEGGGEAARPEA